MTVRDSGSVFFYVSYSWFHSWFLESTASDLNTLSMTVWPLPVQFTPYPLSTRSLECLRYPCDYRWLWMCCFLRHHFGGKHRFCFYFMSKEFLFQYHRYSFLVQLKAKSQSAMLFDQGNIKNLIGWMIAQVKFHTSPSLRRITQSVTAVPIS